MSDADFIRALKNDKTFSVYGRMTLWQEEKIIDAKAERLRNLPLTLGKQDGLHLLNALSPRIEENGFRRWDVLLRIDGKEINTSYGQGSAWIAPPTALDVLLSLFMDASGMDWHTFESWCGEYGYDTDSRKAEATFNACRDIRTALVRVFGGQYEQAEREILATDHDAVFEGWGARIRDMQTFR